MPSYASCVSNVFACEIVNPPIKKADTKKAVYNIFSQTVRRLGAKDMEKLFDVIEDIFELVPLYELGSDISDEAVDTSYNAMKKDISEL